MSTIFTLNKKGRPLQTKVKETVTEMWEKINGGYEPNTLYSPRDNHDFILLKDSKENPLIFNKRFLWKITEE